MYRMGYHENAYERTLRLKYRACQKRYLVTVLGLRLLHPALAANGTLTDLSLEQTCLDDVGVSAIARNNET